MTASPPPIRLAVLDSDTGFLQVLLKRLEGAGWQHRVLASPVPLDAIVAMRLNAVVSILPCSGRRAGTISRSSARACRAGCRGLHRSVLRRPAGARLRLGADDWVTSRATRRS